METVTISSDDDDDLGILGLLKKERIDSPVRKPAKETDNIQSKPIQTTKHTPRARRNRKGNAGITEKTISSTPAVSETSKTVLQKDAVKEVLETHQKDRPPVIPELTEADKPKTPPKKTFATIPKMPAFNFELDSSDDSDDDDQPLVDLLHRKGKILTV